MLKTIRVIEEFNQQLEALAIFFRSEALEFEAVWRSKKYSAEKIARLRITFDSYFDSYSDVELELKAFAFKEYFENNHRDISEEVIFSRLMKLWDIYRFSAATAPVQVKDDQPSQAEVKKALTKSRKYLDKLLSVYLKNLNTVKTDKFSVSIAPTEVIELSEPSETIAPTETIDLSDFLEDFLREEKKRNYFFVMSESIINTLKAEQDGINNENVEAQLAYNYLIKNIDELRTSALIEYKNAYQNHLEKNNNQPIISQEFNKNLIKIKSDYKAKLIDVVERRIIGNRRLIAHEEKAFLLGTDIINSLMVISVIPANIKFFFTGHSYFNYRSNLDKYAEGFIKDLRQEPKDNSATRINSPS